MCIAGCHVHAAGFCDCVSMCGLDGMVVLVRRISEYNNLSVGMECGIEVGRECSRVFLRELYRFHIVQECNSDGCLMLCTEDIRNHTASHRPFVIPSHSLSPSLTAQSPPNSNPSQGVTPTTC
jgi:hypothetical protein